MKHTKLLSVILTAALSTGVTSVVSADDTIKVFLNGEKINFDVPPQIINDYTMVPMRAIFEALGYDVTWNPENRSILATNNASKKCISIAVGDPILISFTYDEKLSFDAFPKAVYSMSVSPMIIEDRTLVPLRAVSEASGATVQWDESSRTVTIEYNIAPTQSPITTVSPKPTQTPEPTATPEPELKYYSGTNLLRYDNFTDLSYVKTGNKCYYETYEPDLQTYIEILTHDGWEMIESEPGDYYILKKDDEVVRIIVSEECTAILIGEEYLDINKYVFFDEGKKMLADADDDGSYNENSKNNNGNDIDFVDDAFSLIIKSINNSPYGISGSELSLVIAQQQSLNQALDIEKLSALPQEYAEYLYNTAEKEAYDAYRSQLEKSNDADIVSALHAAYDAYVRALNI